MVFPRTAWWERVFGFFETGSLHLAPTLLETYADQAGLELMDSLLSSARTLSFLTHPLASDYFDLGQALSLPDAEVH